MAPPEKQLGFSSPMEVMPQSQVIFLQPMLSNGNSSSSSPMSGSENVRLSKSYMPILKSYPRIAPHPADVATNRAGSSRMRVSSASLYDQRQRRHHHSQRLATSSRPQPTLQAAVKPNFGAANNQSQVAESLDSSLSLLAGTKSLPTYTNEIRTDIDRMHADQDPFSLQSNKQKRFSNTYNILNQSGLLGITMRTKQLIKENKRTQSQLQHLQEQTGLLLEALSSGDPQLWSKLELSLQRTDKEQWVAKAQGALE